MLMRSGLRSGFIVIGVSAYASIAVLGWGGFRPFFCHAPLTALVVLLFALSILSFFAGGNVNAGVHEAPAIAGSLPCSYLLDFSMPICPPTPIVKSSGLSTAIRFAGWVWHYSLLVARCGSGQCLF